MSFIRIEPEDPWDFVDNSFVDYFCRVHFQKSRGWIWVTGFQGWTEGSNRIDIPFLPIENNHGMDSIETLEFLE
jgi:hypothetical protein